MPLLPILYRDAHLVAVNKPAGLSVHRSALDRHAAATVLEMLSAQTGLKGYPAHRLDRPTSGVLLLALDPLTARLLGELISGSACTKRITRWCVAGCLTTARLIIRWCICLTNSPTATGSGKNRRRMR